jgi:hypothetical protein
MGACCSAVAWRRHHLHRRGRQLQHQEAAIQAAQLAAADAAAAVAAGIGSGAVRATAGAPSGAENARNDMMADLAVLLMEPSEKFTSWEAVASFAQRCKQQQQQQQQQRGATVVLHLHATGATAVDVEAGAVQQVRGSGWVPVSNSSEFGWHCCLRLVVKHGVTDKRLESSHAL